MTAAYRDLHVAQACVPRLLVSVRTVAEAAAAIAGGCHVIDIKEPHRGSLGMADPAVIRAIADFVQAHSPTIATTAALGEACEYRGAEQNVALEGLDFVKLGSAKLASISDWQGRLQQIRHEIGNGLSQRPQWVAVAYADWNPVEAPRPDEIITEAIASGCRGVLFDTYVKQGRGLLSWMSVSELQVAADRLHEAGLFLALAGSLKSDDLSTLRAVPADIIGIRGAACQQGQRKMGISEEAVTAFRMRLEVIRR